MEIHNHEEYGLFPDTWGPHAWEYFHSTSYAYPLEPSNDTKKHYKKFFNDIKYTLPCSGCRKSYGEFISEGPLKLTDDVFKNRDSLTKWVYDLHERVNKKLGKTYNITFDDVNKKYNAYRMKDNMDLTDRAICYEAECKKEVPYFDMNVAKQFIEYAKKRNVKTFEKNINKYNNLDKNSKEWEERTKYCLNNIKNMRSSALSSIEQEGEYKNLPTIDELKLMEKLCTTLPQEKIEAILNILNGTINENDLAEDQGRCTECAKPMEEVKQKGGAKPTEEVKQKGGVIHTVKYKFVQNKLM